MISLALDVLKEIAKNIGMGIPAVRAWRLKKPRAGANFRGNYEELERYAFLPLRYLLKALGSVRDLDIIEIGPGDFMTSGLALLAAGAKSYTVIDRFLGDYKAPQAKVWYGGIYNAWSRSFPAFKWPEYLRTDAFPEQYRDCVTVLRGSIEDAQIERKFDVVCSFQVGEHVNDIEVFAKANARLLKPGAVAVHRVDFGPHDCWCDYPNPITFLRFPDWLWTAMGSNRGTPNRRRHHEFCAAFERAGLKVNVVNIEHFSSAIANESGLAKRFRSMPLASLAVCTAVYACELRTVGDHGEPEKRR
jgi:SAM-dependent methyltransferase